MDEPDALGDGQPGLRVPARVVEDEDDDPVATGAGLAGEGGEERLEERLETPFAKYQKTSPELGWTKAIT